jgi:hypothetical protein
MKEVTRFLLSSNMSPSQRKQQSSIVLAGIDMRVRVRGKFSVEETCQHVNIHASHDFILEKSTDMRMLIHTNGGSTSSNRLLHFVSRAPCRFWQMGYCIGNLTWLSQYSFSGNSIKFQSLRINQAFEWRKTSTQATSISFTSKICWKTKLDWIQ